MDIELPQDELSPLFAFNGGASGAGPSHPQHERRKSVR